MIPNGPLAVIAKPVIREVLNAVANPADVAEPVVDVINEMFFTSSLDELEVILIVVARPTLSVTDNVRFCAEPFELPPAPTIELGETVKLVIRQLSLNRVRAVDVLKPFGAPCTVTAKP